MACRGARADAAETVKDYKIQQTMPRLESRVRREQQCRPRQWRLQCLRQRVGDGGREAVARGDDVGRQE